MDLFELHCKAMNLIPPVREYKFHPTRRWRIDHAWPSLKLAVEIEGGVFKPGGSRHSRGAGYRKDLEKYNELTVMGWSILRFLPEQVESGLAIETILRWITEEEKRRLK